ncbi:MAG: hypothetical protein IMZ62_00535 [Chloroflexi bacterium]|nr:hypothetical protein [Chloroflexota bacterium]
MRMITKTVNSGGQPVGTAEVEQFDSVAEAVEHLGEPKILKLLNTQHATNAANLLRASIAGRPSQKQLVENAWMELVDLPEFAEMRKDKASCQAWVARRASEMQDAADKKAEEAVESPSA